MGKILELANCFKIEVIFSVVNGQKLNKKMHSSGHTACQVYARANSIVLGSQKFFSIGSRIGKTDAEIPSCGFSYALVTP